MKPRLFIYACIVSWLSSCHGKCASQFFSNVVFANPIASTDSAIVIVKFAKGNNFTAPIDSTIIAKSPGSTIFPYDFSNPDMEYSLRLLPSGETHKITNIRYGDEKNTSHGGHTTQCSRGYAVDGKDNFQSAQDQSTIVSPTGAYIIVN